MGRVTDKERREASARLRNVEMHAIPDARIADNPMTAEFIAAAVFYDSPYVQGLFARLAELIEPIGRRDALLDIVEAMELRFKSASEEEGGDGEVDAWWLGQYARLIRGILGVADD